MSRIKRIEIIITISMILIALMAIVLVKFFTSGTEVHITVGGENYGIYSLDTDREIEIITSNGSNVLKIADKEAFMLHASCPDKICVGMHALSKDAPGVIVCLPNEVIVELK